MPMGRFDRSTRLHRRPEVGSGVISTPVGGSEGHEGPGRGRGASDRVSGS